MVQKLGYNALLAEDGMVAIDDVYKKYRNEIHGLILDMKMRYQ